MLRKATFILVSFVLTTAALYAQNPDSRFDEIDQMRDTGQFQEALAQLEAMSDESPQDAEVLWRLSRTRVDLGELGPEDQREPYYLEAMEEATAAVAAAPENPETYLALAIAAGRVGLISGTRRKVELSRVVKENVDKAIELDPDFGIAYHVRGRWNYEVADLGFMERAVVKVVYGGLPKASFEQAASDFRRAIASEDNVINRLQLGKTYLKLGDKNAARDELERALQMPNDDPDDPEHKKEASALLKKL